MKFKPPTNSQRMNHLVSIATIFEPPKPPDFHFGLVELSGCLAATHSEALPLILIFLAMFLYGPAWRGGKGE